MPYWCTIAGLRLLTIFGQQPENSPCSGARWLHPREQLQLAKFSAANRRAGWLRGRLAIKQLIQHLDPQRCLPQELEIVSRDEQRDLNCAPRVYAAGTILKWRPSLTHTERHFAACLADDPSLSIGIDLVEQSELNSSRLTFWLRDDERERLEQFGTAADSARRALARLWSGKEAAFKTLPPETPFQPQQIAIQDWDDQQTSSTWRTTDNAFNGSLRWDELPTLTLTLAVRQE